MIIIYTLLALLIVFELVTIGVYGRFVSEELTEVYMNLDTSKLQLNRFSASILNTGTKAYIATVPFSLFSKYHINELGTVPRWSKLHKQINKYYAIAVKN